jgi:DNA end-binding protein Ku
MPVKATTKSTKRKRTVEEEEDQESPSRPIWKGAISFGLVNIPISLVSLEQKDEVSFRLLDSRDNQRIRYTRVNESTGETVPWDEVVKAYEYTDGNYVLLTDEDFDKIKIESTKTIEIEDFVDRNSITSVFLSKPYAVIPAKKAEKGYVLLRDVLKKLDKAGIAKVTLRTREYLAAVIAQEDALVLILLRFANELRSLDNLKLPTSKPSSYNISEREQQLAEQLVVSMEAEWDPTKYRDTYRDSLLQYVEAKVQGGEITQVESMDEDEDRTSSNVIDLAALLRESVEKGGKDCKKA